MCRKATVAAAGLWLLFWPLHCAGLLIEAQSYYCGGPCTIGVATASLAMTLRGSGAHRELVYHLKLQCPLCDHSASEGAGIGAASGAERPPPPGPRCGEAVLLQPLPPGIFVDIYHLDNAAAMGQGPKVKLFGPVDVESIERYSQPTVLAVLPTGRHAGSGLTPRPPATAAGAAEGLASDEQDAATDICSMAMLAVPLHARYPPPAPPLLPQPQAAPWWRVAALSVAVPTKMPAPHVLVRCPSCNNSAQVHWQAVRLDFQTAARAAGGAGAVMAATADYTASPAAVVWDRPAGNLEHGAISAGGTVAALLLGVAAVLRALCRPIAHAEQERHKRD